MTCQGGLQHPHPVSQLARAAQRFGRRVRRQPFTEVRLDEGHLADVLYRANEQGKAMPNPVEGDKKKA